MWVYYCSVHWSLEWLSFLLYDSHLSAFKVEWRSIWKFILFSYYAIFSLSFIFKGLFIYLLFLYLLVSLCICLGRCTHLYVYEGARRGHRMPWSWNNRLLGASGVTSVCWDLNSSSRDCTASTLTDTVSPALSLPSCRCNKIIQQISILCRNDEYNED